ncbi:solute carrier family 35 member SLC35F1/F2/F6 [Mycena rosella]|uniref:Solute carrier family 35 member SLC35F1/F2/F6 n=1 Tax=Mycena rosella TaxID=1033263 RepID=A0AAD7GAX3_MYCRO|nr:solute carrier family 35 member SLC35F1/F2/F6 [Mycena rosella]
MDSSDQKVELPEFESPELRYNAPISAQRPPIEYTSVSAFFGSSARRFKSLWTRRFTLSLLAGQLVSLCITCTNVTTTELVNRNWTLSTTQSLFLYFSLFAVYTPYTIYRYGIVGWGKMVVRDGWKYFILAACDVEGNFMVVKAYQDTDLLSCMLLDAWAIPVCMFFSWLFMKPKYHWTQLLGVFICVTGLGLLVGSDELTQKDWTAAARGRGDAFMIAGATLYGITNATEEFFVRKRPLYEVVGQLGMWGFLICGAQAAGLEHEAMTTVTWNGATIGLILAYTAAMFILYTVAPLLYRMASSAYYNLSLLSSDWYGLIFGLGLYHYSPYWLYFIAFALVLVGLITYFWHSTPEEQGEADPKAPEYVDTRDARLQRSEAAQVV